ncbi:hypothetical protein [Frateuria defendens]|uniref:hypothetical protein n=1 Tax=Frateuria defendens TaxID=2219559 RepID=UPI00066FCCC0|nr:hypothetical protein [Frateuria defendens]
MERSTANCRRSGGRCSSRKPVALDGAKTYALADLIDLAESCNPETRIAWNEARRAALAAGMAASAYLPQLTASALEGRQHLAPNRSLHEIKTFVEEGGVGFLMEFGEACRVELESLAPRHKYAHLPR